MRVPTSADLYLMQNRDEASQYSDPMRELVLQSLGTMAKVDGASSKWGKDENEARGNWTHKFEYLFSTLGFVIGLGNVWRFPFLVYKNGGGAFLVPYLIVLVLVGFPLFSMEVSLGQFASLGPLTVWKLAPISKGIGYSMITICFLIGVYYNVLVAYAVYYLVASMQSSLPWAKCNSTWTTQLCPIEKVSGNVSAMVSHNVTMVTWSTASAANFTTAVVTNLTTAATPDENIFGKLLSYDYYYRNVLQISSDVNHLDGIHWPLPLCLLFVWVVIAAMLCFGIKSAGKLSYVITIVPMVCLVVLLIRSILLPGARKGVKFYLTTEWGKLQDPQVWTDAMTQVMFSLSLSNGGLIFLSSFNRFRHNFKKDVRWIIFMDTTVSILAGFTVFCLLGYLAETRNTTVDKVVQSDFGLAFIVFPEVFAQLPVSQLWSVLFFVMLTLFGLTTSIVNLETVVIAMMDEFPKKLKGKRWAVLLLLVAISYLLGIPFVTRGGPYLLELADYYINFFSVMVTGLVEVIAVSWIYGYRKFARDVMTMTGKYPGCWSRTMWQFITPLGLIILLVLTCVYYTGPTSLSADYPTWTVALGWLAAVGCVVLIPAWAVYFLIKIPGSLKDRIRLAARPTMDWGPALLHHRVMMMHQSVSVVSADSSVGNGSVEKGESESVNQGAKLKLARHVHLPVYESTVDVPLVSTAKIKSFSRTVSGLFGKQFSHSKHEGETTVDEEERRPPWSRGTDFLMCLLGASLGVSTLWQFPILCFQHGGGTFMVAYLLVIIIMAAPMLFLEFSFSQYISSGVTIIWKAFPIAKGIGIGMCVYAAMVLYHLGIWLSWSLHFLFSSIQTTVPWNTCNATNTNCSLQCVGYNQPLGQCSGLLLQGADKYLRHDVLQLSDSVNTFGSIQWKLLLLLLLCWVLVCLVLIRGHRSAAKFMYFIVLAVLGLMIALMIHAANNGSLDGLKVLLESDWSAMGTVGLWRDVVLHVTLTFVLGTGVLHTLSSRNKFQRNSYRDVMIVVIVKYSFSLFTSFFAFAAMGSSATYLMQEVVLTSDLTPEVAMEFVVLPAALSTLPSASVWSGLMFLASSLARLSALTMFTYSILSTVEDEIHWVKHKLWRHWLVLLGGIAVIFLLQIPCCTQAGLWIASLVRRYSSAWVPVVLLLAEAVVLIYGYGLHQVSKNAHVMTDYTPGLFWKGCWLALVPLALLYALAAQVAELAQHGDRWADQVHLASWARAVGWVISALPILPALAWALVIPPLWHRSSEDSVKIRYRKSLHATDDFQPAREEDRYEVADCDFTESSTGALAFLMSIAGGIAGRRISGDGRSASLPDESSDNEDVISQPTNGHKNTAFLDDDGAEDPGEAITSLPWDTNSRVNPLDTSGETETSDRKVKSSFHVSFQLKDPNQNTRAPIVSNVQVPCEVHSPSKEKSTSSQACAEEDCEEVDLTDLNIWTHL